MFNHEIFPLEETNPIENGVRKLRRNNSKNYVTKRLVLYSYSRKTNLAQKLPFLQQRIDLDLHLVLFCQAQDLVRVFECVLVTLNSIEQLASSVQSLVYIFLQLNHQQKG